MTYTPTLTVLPARGGWKSYYEIEVPLKGIHRITVPTYFGERVITIRNGYARGVLPLLPFETGRILSEELRRLLGEDGDDLMMVTV